MFQFIKTFDQKYLNKLCLFDKKKKKKLNTLFVWVKIKTVMSIK